MVCNARKIIAKTTSMSNHAMKIKSLAPFSFLLCLMKSFFFVVCFAKAKVNPHTIYMHHVQCMAKVVGFVLFVFVSCTSALEIKCLHVYDSLKQHVRSSHAWPVLEDAHACMSDALVRKSLMYVSSDTLHVENDVFLLTNDSVALAELLTFSLMGRHFDQQASNQGIFFNWNRYYETLSVELLPCEFSRPLYNFVLLFTLLFLLSFVVMQQYAKVKAEPSTAPAVEKETANAGPVAFRSTTTARQVQE